MSLTVRIVRKHILSRASVSVRPSNVFIREHPTYRGNRVVSAYGYLNSQRSALSQAERTVTVGRHRIVIAIAIACARVCTRARMRACVCACVMCLQYMKKYLTQAYNNNNFKLLSYISYKSDTLMISPQRVYRLVGPTM